MFIGYCSHALLTIASLGNPASSRSEPHRLSSLIDMAGRSACGRWSARCRPTTMR
ncbi:hypothetical protein BURMUCF1_A1942 [Burkholderia multivorans ATCC BAA-247]|uniref:Uncharacterized protein n=1 Tax=Burkholderia multivorans CGD2 TaxID=513052 RepID=B9BLN4_9BURK|nr:hypothetical protein BURMUCGD2_5992 [Burkholderia multivorans CGD2]EEE16536.1 hypothetical protein BURMUCGD2M_5981 [Burkholderia multivorans CGD2M]EJO52105.1 hypothetical protein BURMUCF1_A1942 [Burkholderia multivorans ATCC BAA-247]